MATPTNPTSMDSNEASTTGALELLVPGGGAAAGACAATSTAANAEQMAKTRAIFWKAIYVWLLNCDQLELEDLAVS